ncbi:MAG: hypothetical protein ACREGA_04245 [Candidatus Saccharimonadales bacterium]
MTVNVQLSKRLGLINNVEPFVSFDNKKKSQLAGDINRGATFEELPKATQDIITKAEQNRAKEIADYNATRLNMKQAYINAQDAYARKLSSATEADKHQALVDEDSVAAKELDDRTDVDFSIDYNSGDQVTDINPYSQTDYRNFIMDWNLPPPTKRQLDDWIDLDYILMKEGGYDVTELGYKDPEPWYAELIAWQKDNKQVVS